MASPPLLGLEQTSILSLTLMALCFLTLFLRLCARGLICRKMGADDCFITMASACLVTGLSIVHVASHPIKAAYEGNIEQRDLAIHYLELSSSMYSFTSLFLKLSLGFFFLRYFSGLAPPRIAIWCTMAVACVTATIHVSMDLTTCGVAHYYFAAYPCPIYTTWHDLNQTWSVLNVAGNLVFPLLAINALRTAKVNRTAKVLAGIIIGLGTLAFAGSLCRLAMIVTDDHGLATPARTTTNAFWTNLEVGVGISSANLACLWPLVRWVRERCGTPEPLECWHRTRVSELQGGTRGWGDDAGRLWVGTSALEEGKAGRVMRVYDWRDDRITVDEEITVPAKVVLMEVVTISEDNSVRLDRVDDLDTRL